MIDDMSAACDELQSHTNTSGVNSACSLLLQYTVQLPTSMYCQQRVTLPAAFIGSRNLHDLQISPTYEVSVPMFLQ